MSAPLSSIGLEKVEATSPKPRNPILIDSINTLLSLSAASVLGNELSTVSLTTVLLERANFWRYLYQLAIYKSESCPITCRAPIIVKLSSDQFDAALTLLSLQCLVTRFSLLICQI